MVDKRVMALISIICQWIENGGDLNQHTYAPNVPATVAPFRGLAEFTDNRHEGTETGHHCKGEII